MSRRSIPPIAPTDLRDHADEGRIGRIWDRIENDLVGLQQPAPRRSSGLAVALLAAAVAAFAGGLLLGRVVWRDPPASLPPIASPDRPGLEVFAAGSQERTFSLPGGGEITLRPGATVEVERSDGDALTLRLVQGDATLDAQPRASAFAVVVGDARLASAAGSVLRVRRDANNMDVEVTSGSVKLVSPTESREIRAGQRVDSVPLHTVTAIAPTTPLRHDKAPAPSVSPIEGLPPGEPPSVAVAAPTDWHGAWKSGDFATGFKLLRDQPGGIAGAIAAAKDASELLAISDVTRQKGGDPAMGTAALTKAVEAFPNDPNAAAAAYLLGQIFEKQGSWAKARQYYQHAQSVSTYAAEASCGELRAAIRGGSKDEGVRTAKEYLAKHPASRCRELAERVAKGEDVAHDDDTAPEPSGSPREADSVGTPHTPGAAAP